MNFDPNTVAVMLEMPRQMGKTEAICKMAKEHGAGVFCHTEEEARRLQREYDVDAYALGSAEKLRGSRKVMFIDNHAVYCLLLEMERRNSEMRTKLEKAEQKLKRIQEVLTA